jgi:hypothetical protein
MFITESKDDIQNGNTSKLLSTRQATSRGGSVAKTPRGFTMAKSPTST